VNDLDLLDRDIVLVLDDYHVIESTELHEAVELLLEHLPPQLQLVVATRSVRWGRQGCPAQSQD
jgi:LuxR family transcriptional regulator, maltose regulon positive regulatory protein